MISKRRCGRGVIVALAVMTLTTAGCSGGDDGSSVGSDPIGTAIAAMGKAGSGRIAGSVQGPEGKAPGTIEGEWAGDMSGKGSVRAEIVSKDGTKLPVELRWLDKKLFIKRAGVELPDGDPFTLFTHTARFKPWRESKISGGSAAFLPSAFAPTSVLAWLKTLRLDPKVHDGEKVGSVKATRLTTPHPISIGAWVGATVDVWLDESNRVIRVRIASPTGGLDYEVTDFGTPVDVKAPPASEITDESELVKIGPAGDFKTVKSGTTNNVNWQLQRADGTQGTTCWRWQATPALTQQLEKPNDGRCLRPVDSAADFDERIQFLIYGNGLGSYDALVADLPEGVTELELGFQGGKTEKVAVSSPLVWVGPSSPKLLHLGVTHKDGTKADCGAGAVTSVDDLSNPSLTAGAATAAWACLPSQD